MTLFTSFRLIILVQYKHYNMLPVLCTMMFKYLYLTGKLGNKQTNKHKEENCDYLIQLFPICDKCFDKVGLEAEISETWTNTPKPAANTTREEREFSFVTICLCSTHFTKAAKRMIKLNGWNSPIFSIEAEPSPNIHRAPWTIFLWNLQVAL